jgi:hypothetical protein
MVFHPAQQHDIAGFEARQRPCVRDQIDRERRAAAQHQLVAMRVEKRRKLRSRRFVRVRRFAAEGMHGTTDVRVVATVEIVDRIDDG